MGPKMSAPNPEESVAICHKCGTRFRPGDECPECEGDGE